MLALIKISNDPNSGLGRKVRWSGFNDFGDYGRLNFEVLYFNASDVEINAQGISSYTKELIADNSTPVDSSGNFSFNPDGSPLWGDGILGEYDFLVALVNSPTALISVLVKMIRNAATIADEVGKFNN
jgi:hypothetical protein